VIEIVCWNIRWGQGHDGTVDLDRIVDTVMAMGDPDILCFQEVARNFPELDGQGADQPRLLGELLPQYEPIFGCGTNTPGERIGKRRQFGNVVLTRLPALQAFSHLLPRPATDETPHMQREALEVIVATGLGPLRIINTHLEYYSAEHRAAQLEHLRRLHQQAGAYPAQTTSSQGPVTDPYVPAVGPCPTVLCGDFNMEKSEPSYARLVEPFDNGTQALVDAWTVVHPGKDHPITCGVYELVHWSGTHCRDFIFITPDLAKRARAMDVDTETAASDHQPLRLVLDDATA
jgi:endonuclease/exonuclease/phosphatase family metal-dependent hydrolase